MAARRIHALKGYAYDAQSALVASRDIIDANLERINERPPSRVSLAREVAKFVMFSIAFVLFFAILLFLAEGASGETFNEKFCRGEHPNDDTCLKWAEQEDHKSLILGGGEKHRSILYIVPYDPAEEERKLKLWKPAPSGIIMDSSPAKEIPMGQ